MAKRYRRSGISQSRFGCLTCKARKVKCDEAHRKPESSWYPSCSNCAKGGRRCEFKPDTSTLQLDTTGYLRVPLTPITESSSPARIMSTSPASFFSSSPAQSASRLEGAIARARTVLLQSHIDDFGLLSDILDNSFSGYDHLYESTRYAAAAFEAAGIESAQGSRLAESTYTEYNHAIHSLRMELDIVVSGSRSSIPLTFILLICVGLMLRRRQDAMMHLSGLIRFHRKQQPLLTPEPHHNDEDFKVLLRSLEINKMASADYAVPNEIDPVQVYTELPVPSDLNLLGRHVINMVHASHVFIFHASIAGAQDKVTPSHLTTWDIIRNNISLICVSLSELLMMPGSSVRDAAHLRRLHCICLSMYIELSNLFCVSENSYDVNAPEFELIVTNAEHILAARKHDNNSRQLVGPAFSLQIGIAQPLYLAATRYRRQSWRLRAIACLKEIEQEGSWHGPLLTAVAYRWASIEHPHLQTSAIQSQQIALPPNGPIETHHNFLATHTAIDEALILPQARITACRFADYSSVRNYNKETDMALTVSPGSLARTKVMFIQRTNITTALPARVLQCFDAAQKVFTAGALPIQLDCTQWYAWSEYIAF